MSIAVVWISFTIAVFVVVARMPSVYRAEALIQVDSQKIPERYVSSTVVSDARDRVAAISQQVLSTGRLQTIIDEFDLYNTERRTRYPEEILAQMRKDITVVPEESQVGRSGAFRISYQSTKRLVVARVTNRIANLYVDENLKAREVQAEGTSEFIESQVTEAKRNLDEVEAAVSQYKLTHNGELPQQEGSLDGMLGRLQVTLEANRDAINRAQQSRVTLESALSAAEASEQAQEKSIEPVSGSRASVIRAKNTSEVLRAKLQDLRSRYSDQHPDVKRLSAELEHAEILEKQQPSASPEETAVAVDAAQNHPPTTIKVNKSPELVQAQERVAAVKSQLALVNQELETRQTEQQRILRDIAFYQGKVNRLPIREQEMAKLTRDYEVSKLNYRSLLDKKFSAEMASDMERLQKSERFTIVDAARVPANPVKPRRILINFAGSVMGLVLSLGLAFGREFQQGALLGEWEIPKNVIILGRIPYIKGPPDDTLSRWPDSVDPKRKAVLKGAIVLSTLLVVIGITLLGLFLTAHWS